MTFTNVHLGDTKIGSGWRCVVVLKTGPKWVTAFYPPTCDTLKIPRAAFDKAPKEEVPIRKRALIRRIRDNARENLTVAAKEAIAIVRSA